MTKNERVMVPSLRFPGFDGKWKVKLLSEVADFRNGKAHEQAISKEGMFVVVNSKFISTEGRVRKYSDTNIAPLISGEIVMVMSDIPKGRALAKCYFVEEENVFTLNQRICAISATKANGKFLFFRINRNRYFLEFDSGVGQTNLRKDEVLDCPLRCPEALPEQRKIADFLTAVDERIGQLIQKKALLEDYKKGVMQQLFTQAIRFKDDHGNDFPDWEEKKLGDVASVVGGGTPDSTNEAYWNGDVQWFTPTEIRSKFAGRSKRTISQSGLKKCSAAMLPVGTLLFTSRATIAEVSIATAPCTTNQGFQSITVNSGASNEFIYYWVIQFKKEFLRKAQGSTFLEIGGKEVRKMPMLIPSFPEQTKIADFLSAIDRKIESVATQITETQTFKRGLLQQMFV